jgi:hypothetical protein
MLLFLGLEKIGGVQVEGISFCGEDDEDVPIPGLPSKIIAR